MPVACHSGPCHIWAASLTLLPPNQKYNSWGALCDSLLIAPSLLHRESGAVSRPIHSTRNPYWFSGSFSLRYRQSIILQPPLWWELAVALNPILRSRSSRFLIMSYSNISKSFCQRLIYIINATDINIFEKNPTNTENDKFPVFALSKSLECSKYNLFFKRRPRCWGNRLAGDGGTARPLKLNTFLYYR